MGLVGQPDVIEKRRGPRAVLATDLQDEIDIGRHRPPQQNRFLKNQRLSRGDVPRPLPAPVDTARGRGK